MSAKDPTGPGQGLTAEDIAAMFADRDAYYTQAYIDECDLWGSPISADSSLEEATAAVIALFQGLLTAAVIPYDPEVGWDPNENQGYSYINYLWKLVYDNITPPS